MSLPAERARFRFANGAYPAQIHWSRSTDVFLRKSRYTVWLQCRLAGGEGATSWRREVVSVSFRFPIAFDTAARSGMDADLGEAGESANASAIPPVAPMAAFWCSPPVKG